MARPLKYKNAQEVQEIIDAYLSGCNTKGNLPTKSGACLALDMGRESWREYKEKEGFVDTFKRLENIIEEAWVQRLTAAACTGAIFYLKNAFKEEYKDRQETDITSGGKPLNLTFDKSFEK